MMMQRTPLTSSQVGGAQSDRAQYSLQGSRRSGLTSAGDDIAHATATTKASSPSLDHAPRATATAWPVPSSMSPRMCVKPRSFFMRMGIIACIVAFSLLSAARTVTLLSPRSSRSPQSPQSSTMSTHASSASAELVRATESTEPTAARAVSSSQSKAFAALYQVDPTKGPVCVQRFYGSNCNRMISLAKALDLAKKMSTMVRLDDEWTQWFLRFFDPHPRIILSNTFVVSNTTAAAPSEPGPKRANDPTIPQASRCIRTVEGRELYAGIGLPPAAIHRGSRVPILDQLVPKRSIREEAERRVRELYADIQQAPSATEEHNQEETAESPLQYPFVSVHRRWMDGGCLEVANRRKHHFDKCTASTLIAACEYAYDTVLHTISKEPSPSFSTQMQMQANGPARATTDGSIAHPTAGNSAPPRIVLFTDGQNEAFDSTFPIRDTSEFPLQLWMMTLSQQHFGNPLSTVDIVVRHWRHHRIEQYENGMPPTGDGMHPVECNPSWT